MKMQAEMSLDRKYQIITIAPPKQEAIQLPIPSAAGTASIGNESTAPISGMSKL